MTEMGFFRSAKANALNAQPEGDDIVLEQEPPREQTRVPVAFDTLYNRLNLALMPYGALIAVLEHQENVLAEPEFTVFKAELMEGGAVTKIDLVEEARKAGVLEDCERAIARWTTWPIPTR
jgi:hypothetical protein